MPPRLLLAALWLLVGAVASGQEIKLPAQVTGGVGDFVVVTAETDDTTVKWFVVDSALKLFPQELQNDTKKAVVIALTPGRYRLLAVSAKDGVPSDFAECVVAIGGVIPVPPPGPDPPPVPPDPTPAGKRSVIILRESAESSPQLARLLTALQTGSFSEYRRAHGHSLHILDGSGGEGADWMPHAAGLTLPVVVVYDPHTKAVLHKGPLPDNVPAILETLKKHGG